MIGRQRKHGFTLVEILIVVVILGILAAIVIPQFTNASEAAKGSSLLTQLQTIRSQLELYQIQHNGTYPTAAQLNVVAPNEWGVMTKETDVTGAIVVGGDYGPYLQQPPVNPFEDTSVVAAAAAADVGWVYNESTGAITAVMEAAKAAEVFGDAASVPVNDVTTY